MQDDLTQVSKRPNQLFNNDWVPFKIWLPAYRAWYDKLDKSWADPREWRD